MSEIKVIFDDHMKEGNRFTFLYLLPVYHFIDEVTYLFDPLFFYLALELLVPVFELRLVQLHQSLDLRHANLVFYYNIIISFDNLVGVFIRGCELVIYLLHKVLLHVFFVNQQFIIRFYRRVLSL